MLAARRYSDGDGHFGSDLTGNPCLSPRPSVPSRQCRRAAPPPQNPVFILQGLDFLFSYPTGMSGGTSSVNRISPIGLQRCALFLPDPVVA